MPAIMKKPAAAPVEEEEVDDVPQTPPKASRSSAATPGTPGTSKKRPAAAMDEEEEVEEEQEEPQPTETAEEKLAREETEMQSVRRKELKAVNAADLKEMALSKGLEPGKKETMMESILEAEAKARKDARDRDTNIRFIVVKKKEEYEALNFDALRKTCADAGIKGRISREAGVSELLRLWQEDDGIDKGLALMAYEARKTELSAMDTKGLMKLCEANGTNPYVKEVMVDRVVKKETASGKFARLTVEEKKDAEPDKTEDAVEAVLANETNRKKKLELQRQQEEAIAAKKKELRSNSMDELKRILTERGIDPILAASANSSTATSPGRIKKDDLVDVLYGELLKDEAIEAKKNGLRAMATDDLKALLVSKGLDAVGKKEAMVEAVMAYEKKCKEDMELFDQRVAEVLAKKRDELDALSNQELIDMCLEKGLKQGTAKRDRMERLLVELQKTGEVETAVASIARKARRVELLSLDKVALLKLCTKNDVDPLVKEVLVERIMTKENGGFDGSDELADEPEAVDETKEPKDEELPEEEQAEEPVMKKPRGR